MNYFHEIYLEYVESDTKVYKTDGDLRSREILENIISRCQKKETRSRWYKENCVNEAKLNEKKCKFFHAIMRDSSQSSFDECSIKI